MNGSIAVLALGLCAYAATSAAQVVVLTPENGRAEQRSDAEARAAQGDRADARTDRSIARYDDATGHDRAAAEARGAARAESRDARQEQKASNRADNRADQGGEVIIRP